MKFDHSAPTFDRTFDILADARRRTVLHFLCEQPDNVTLIEELIRHLDNMSTVLSQFGVNAMDWFSTILRCHIA